MHTPDGAPSHRVPYSTCSLARRTLWWWCTITS